MLDNNALQPPQDDQIQKPKPQTPQTPQTGALPLAGVGTGGQSGATPIAGATAVPGAPIATAGAVSDPLAFAPAGNLTPQTPNLLAPPSTTATATTPPVAFQADATHGGQTYLGKNPVTGLDWWDADTGNFDQTQQALTGQYDASGKPLWQTGDASLTQSDIARRKSLVDMTPEQRQAELARLEAAGAGNATDTSSHGDYDSYQTLQQLLNPNSLYDYSQLAEYGGGLNQSTKAAQDLFASVKPKGTALAANATDNGFSTIQGGKTYTDPIEAQAAFDAINGPSAANAGGQTQSLLDQVKAGGGASDANPLTALPQTGGGTLSGPVTGGNAPGGGTGPSVGPGSAYSTAAIDPNSALLSQVITPDAGLDRYKMALDSLENYRKGTEGTFKADSDAIARNSFGAGRGVSGMNRTRQGDLALARENDLNTKAFDYLNNALTGSIEDAKYKTGVAQQQQGYQKSLSDTAFDQENQMALLNEYLTSGAFNRANQQEQSGYAGNPSEIDLLLSKIFGDQSSAAGQAAADSFRNAGNNSGGGGGMSYDDFVKAYEAWRKPKTGGGDGGYVDDTGGDGRLPV